MFNKHSQSVRWGIYADLHLFRLFSLLHSKRYELLHMAEYATVRYFRRSDDAKTVFEVEIPLAKEHNYHKTDLLKEIIDQLLHVITQFIAKINNKSFQEHYARYSIWSEAIADDEAYHLSGSFHMVR